MKRSELGQVTLDLRQAGEKIAHPCDCASRAHRWRGIDCTDGRLTLDDGSRIACPVCRPHSIGEHLWESTRAMAPGIRAQNYDPDTGGWRYENELDPDGAITETWAVPQDAVGEAALADADRTDGLYLRYRQLVTNAQDAALAVSRFIDTYRPDRLVPIGDPITDEEFCTHHLATLGICEPRNGRGDLCRTCYDFSLTHHVLPPRALLEARREGRRWTPPMVEEALAADRARRQAERKGRKKRKGKAS